MVNTTFSTRMIVRWAQRHWIVLAVTSCAFLLLLVGQSVSAADGRSQTYQTVPPPTQSAAQATATPRPSSNDDNNNNDSPADTATPLPAGGQESSPAAAAVAGALAQPAGTTGTVNAVALNVRQAPTTDSPVIGKLTSGTTVQVQGRNAAGDWLFVCCIPATQTSGWVSAEFITPSFAASDLPVVTATATTTATVPVTPSQTAPITAGAAITGGRPATVTVVALNVRAQPTTDSAVVGKLAANATITVIGRNAAGDWLFVCCVPTTQASGWVSGQYVAPTFAPADLPEVTDAGAPVALAAPAATPEALAGTVAAGGPPALSLSIQQQPPYAVQGKEIALVFTVDNTGGTDATNVQLRNELPAALKYVSASADSGGAVTQEEGNAGATVVLVTWPAVAAGGQAAATVRVQVAPDLANGTVFDNLAMVTADNAESTSAGITIGMPPALLPEFW